VDIAKKPSGKPEGFFALLVASRKFLSEGDSLPQI